MVYGSNDYDLVQVIIKKIQLEEGGKIGGYRFRYGYFVRERVSKKGFIKLIVRFLIFRFFFVFFEVIGVKVVWGVYCLGDDIQFSIGSYSIYDKKVVGKQQSLRFIYGKDRINFGEERKGRILFQDIRTDVKVLFRDVIRVKVFSIILQYRSF